MKTSEVIDLIKDLDAAGVRYLVVGGMAVIAHGFSRGTEDVDLVIAPGAENAALLISLLTRRGHRPRAPVNPLDFTDPAKRESWIRDKHMLAFTMLRPRPEAPDVDIFLREPFDFEQEWGQSARYSLGPDASIPIISLETLLRMKDEAGRDKDVFDALMLRKIQAARD